MLVFSYFCSIVHAANQDNYNNVGVDWDNRADYFRGEIVFVGGTDTFFGGGVAHCGSEGFEKSSFQVVAMFIEMPLSRLLELPKRLRRTGSDLESQLLLPGFDHVPRSSAVGPPIRVLGLPSLLGMIATVCATTGLLYTTVRVFEILRGAMLA